MSEIADKLRLTLLCDGGSAETALKEVLKAELMRIFEQFMDVESIDIEVKNNRIEVGVNGDHIKKVGFYYM